MRERASALIAPVVSIATGLNVTVGLMSWYFSFLLSSDWLATADAAVVASVKLEGANVFGQVKSQARHLPCDQGMVVIPSGLRSSDGQSP